MEPLFLNVAKPMGWSSTRVLGFLRRSLTVRTMGHWGTLDPAAAGVLPVAVGPATRLLPYITDTGKRYVAVVRLGVETRTCDLAGETVTLRPVPRFTFDAIRGVLASFTGEILQTPPAFAAVRVGGTRAYERARRGEVVVPAPRKVTVSAIDLLAFRSPDLVIGVACGPGTYIRSLARDIGSSLGTGGVLARLVRSRSGPFHLKDARAPSRFTPEHVAARGPGVIPPWDVLGLPVLDIGAEEARAAREGRLFVPTVDAGARGAVVLLRHGGVAFGIGRVVDGGMHAERVFG